MVHGITYKKALSSAALLAVLAFALFAAGCGGGGGKAQAPGGQNPNTAPGGGQGAPTPTNTAKSTGLKLEIQNDAGGTGPTTMVHDQKKTFKVVYSRSQANNLTASVEVRIDEYEWNGDETLVKPFKVKIKPGETKGHTTLICS